MELLFKEVCVRDSNELLLLFIYISNEAGRVKVV